MRTKITENIKQAMKDKETRRLSTLRLINAAIQDRDIENGKATRRKLQNVPRR